MKELALAIEIKDDALIVCCVRRNAKRIYIIGRDMIPLSNAWMTDDIVTFLSKFMETHKITSKKVSIALPDDWVMIRYLNIPLESPDALNDVMTFELKRHIPYEIDKVLYNYRIVGKINGLYRVILLFITKELWDNVYEKLNQLGLIVENIGLSSLYSLSLISHSELRTNIYKNIIGKLGTIHSENVQKADIVICCSGSIITLGILVDTLPLVQYEVPFKDINDVSYFWSEILLDIEQYISLNMIKQVILFGDDLIELSEHITSLDSYKVRHINKISGISFSKELDGQYQRQLVIKGKTEIDLFPAIGASLSGNGIDILSINILEKKQDKVSTLSMVMAGVQVVIILLIFCVIGWLKYSNNKTALEVTIENIAKNNKAVSEYLSMSSELETINKKINIIKDDKNNSVSAISILTELSKTIPTNTYLTDIVIVTKSEESGKLKQLIISGYSETSSNLIEVLEGTDIIKESKFIAPVISEIKGERFMIESRIVQMKKPSMPKDSENIKPSKTL